MPTGFLPGIILGNIYTLLRAFIKAHKLGSVLGDNVGYTVPKLPSGRESFSPDVSFCSKFNPPNPMAFIQGPPVFAVEVRSEGDYGAAAKLALAEKRADYFAAGTRVVWDVDPIAECVRAYTRISPLRAQVFRRGDVADAELALPGWKASVDEIFELS